MKKLIYRVNCPCPNNEEYSTFTLNIKERGKLPPKNALFMMSIDEKTRFDVNYFDNGKQIIFTTNYNNYSLILTQQTFVDKMISHYKKIERNELTEGIMIHKHLRL